MRALQTQVWRCIKVVDLAFTIECSPNIISRCHSKLLDKSAVCDVSQLSIYVKINTTNVFIWTTSQTYICNQICKCMCMIVLQHCGQHVVQCEQHQSCICVVQSPCKACTYVHVYVNALHGAKRINDVMWFVKQCDVAFEFKQHN